MFQIPGFGVLAGAMILSAYWGVRMAANRHRSTTLWGFPGASFGPIPLGILALIPKRMI